MKIRAFVVIALLVSLLAACADEATPPEDANGPEAAETATPADAAESPDDGADKKDDKKDKKNGGGGAVQQQQPSGGTETGVVTAVDERGGDVVAFDLETDAGKSFTFQIDPKVDYGFDLHHLSEHQTSGDPVRVLYETRNGKLYAKAITDV